VPLVADRHARAGLAVRGRGDRRTAGLFVLGGWFLLDSATLDFSAGIVASVLLLGAGPRLAAIGRGGGSRSRHCAQTASTQGP